MQHKTPIAYPSSRLTDHHTEMSLAERNKLEEDKLRAMSRRKQNFLLMPVKNIDISFNEDSHKGQKNSFSVLKGHPHEYKISVYLKTLHKFNP